MGNSSCCYSHPNKLLLTRFNRTSNSKRGPKPIFIIFSKHWQATLKVCKTILSQKQNGQKYYKYCIQYYDSKTTSKTEQIYQGNKENENVQTS